MPGTKDHSWRLAGDVHRDPGHFVQMWLEGAGPLGTGDAVRFTATGGQRITATEPSEILVWQMPAAIAA